LILLKLILLEFKISLGGAILRRLSAFGRKANEAVNFCHGFCVKNPRQK